jgi:hypothetical protein
MPTKAQLVREALLTEIRKVSGIGATGYLPRNTWRDETNLPAGYLVLEDDDSVRSPTRSKEVEARYRVAFVFRSENPPDTFDDLRGAVEAQIEDDPSLGGLVLDAWYSGCGRFHTAKTLAGDVYVRDVFITVIYRHDRGAP